MAVDVPSTAEAAALLARLRATIGAGGYDRLTGMTIDQARPDWARLSVPVTDQLRNSAGVMHGGMIATLLDAAVTCAAWAWTELPEGTNGATAALTVTYLAPVTSGVLIAEGQVVRRGRRLCVLDGIAWLEEGRPVAKALATYSFSSGRPRPA